MNKQKTKKEIHWQSSVLEDLIDLAMIITRLPRVNN